MPPHRPDGTPLSSMIETYSGLFIDLASPRIEDICIEDIAQAMANTCRFGGHVRTFYSVAEHSVLVAALLVEKTPGVGKTLYEAALLHDAHEAYLGDVVRPLKRIIGGEYEVLTNRLNYAIAKFFDVDVDLFAHPLVKQADNDALMIEASILTHTGGKNWGIPMTQLPSGVSWYDGLDPEAARKLWLEHVDVFDDRNLAA